MPQENIFADIISEGALMDNTVVDNTVDPTTPESQPETKEPVTPQEIIEENLPFHKHPRWQKMYQENERLARESEETQAQLKELKEWKSSQAKQEVNPPDWWKQNYPDDETNGFQGYKTFEKNNQEYKESLKREVIQEIESKTNQMQEAQRKAQQYVDSQFEQLKESDPALEKNVLFKFILDTEAKGILLHDPVSKNYNLQAAHTLYREMNPNKTDPIIEQKKEIAGQSMSSRSAGGKDNIPIVSSDDLRTGNWRNIIRNN